MELFCKCGAALSPSRNGRRIYCFLCKPTKKENDHKQYLANIAGDRERCKQYRLTNLEKLRERDRKSSQKRRLENPEKYREIRRKSARKNRATANVWWKNRRSSDPIFRLTCAARGRIIEALKGNSKSLHTVELIGCRWSELRMWLEFQFQEGMTWENYGPVWHVDHIRPCASYDLSDPEQQKDCFNYKNLQPLFALDNIKKGATYPN